MGRRQDRWASSKGDDDCGLECGLAATGRRGLPPRYGRFFAVAALNIFGALVAVSNARAWAQAAGGEAQAQPPAAAPVPGLADALSARYRFLERYSPEEDPTQPELVTEYQVGIRQTLKAVREKLQGAPERKESWTQTIYTERAAKVTNLGDLVDAVRRYDKFFQKGLPATGPQKTPLFEGLTVWVTRGKAGSPPQILSLTNERPLRESEFKLMLTQVSLPPLKALLPITPRRKGDTWRVPREATVYLLGALPEPEDYALDATLTDVRKAASGNKFVAVIGFSGPVTLPDGPSMVNGEIHFAFEPPTVVPAIPGAGEEPIEADKVARRGSARNKNEGVVDARGWITEVRMARVVEIPQPEGDGRLKTTVTYEIVLARRPLAAANQQGVGQPPPLALPNPPPTPTEVNSWLVYEDPLGRFRFRHPQELQTPSEPMDPDTVELRDLRPEVGVKDVFILQLPPGAEDPQMDRKFHSVDQFRRTLEAEWAGKKLDIVRGPEDWLPEADWTPLKVYRKEIGVKTKAAAANGVVERIYLDYYFVLSNRDDCFHAQSMTIRDNHVTFRTQAERIIKSMEFGPTKLKGAKANSPAAAGSTPPAPPRR